MPTSYPINQERNNNAPQKTVCNDQQREDIHSRQALVEGTVIEAIDVHEWESENARGTLPQGHGFTIHRRPAQGIHRDTEMNPRHQETRKTQSSQSVHFCYLPPTSAAAVFVDEIFKRVLREGSAVLASMRSQRPCSPSILSKSFLILASTCGGVSAMGVAVERAFGRSIAIDMPFAVEQAISLGWLASEADAATVPATLANTDALMLAHATFPGGRPFDPVVQSVEVGMGQCVAACVSEGTEASIQPNRIALDIPPDPRGRNRGSSCSASPSPGQCTVPGI